MKKEVIIGILIAFLVIVGASLILISKNGENQDIIVPSQNDVQNEKKVEDDGLDLTGEPYNAEEGTDANGNKISALMEAGKPMLILYWNAKEESSMEAVINLQKYYNDYKEKVTIMLVAAMDNEDEDKEPAENFLVENNIEIPVIYETIIDSESVANEINNIPTLLVVNKMGVKINLLMDHITEDAIEANLDIITENF